MVEEFSIFEEQIDSGSDPQPKLCKKSGDVLNFAFVHIWQEASAFGIRPLIPVCVHMHIAAFCLMSIPLHLSSNLMI